MADSQIVSKVNSTMIADGNRYVATDMGRKISEDDPETSNIISSTYGMIKDRIWELVYDSVGFDPNVNFAYQQVMTDPNQCIEYKGRKFYQHPGVGAIRAYNEAGNPSQGCFTLHTMA